MVVCHKTFYLEVVSYLMEEYTYTLGKSVDLALALSTQKHYLHYILHDAQRKFGHMDEHKPFFTCLDGTARSWLSAAEFTVERAGCEFVCVVILMEATVASADGEGGWSVRVGACAVGLLCSPLLYPIAFPSSSDMRRLLCLS